MRVLTEAVALDDEMEMMEELGSRIELRAARLLAYLLIDSIPTARLLQLVPGSSDEGRPILICGQIVDENRVLVADTIYDLSAAHDLAWLATLMTEGGAWEVARSDDGQSPGDIWMDLEGAKSIELEGDS